jgi:hypothetical protein
MTTSVSRWLHILCIICKLTTLKHNLIVNIIFCHLYTVDKEECNMYLYICYRSLQFLNNVVINKIVLPQTYVTVSDFCYPGRGRDHIVVVIAYYHWSCEFESCSWRGVLDTSLCNIVCQWRTVVFQEHSLPIKQTSMI